MTKYVNADELLKQLNTCKYPAEKTTRRQVAYNAAISAACRSVDTMPAADVVEVRHGHWIYKGNRGRFPACECSVCGNVENADWAILSDNVNYCPNCGARMEEE